MRLPSVNGLRAFEAAARLLSMKDAAAELHVSPSAVSQLVRTLEGELRCELFERGGRRLALTKAGQVLLPAARIGFALMADAVERVSGERDGGPLRVGATAFFAETWLLPRIPDFTARHPEIDLHVATGVSLANLAAGEADVAIRHGLGAYAGMRADLLLAPPVVPVAAPDLVGQRGRPASATILADWPLLHDADRGGWALWFAGAGAANVGSLRGLSFDDTGLLRAAALAGQGAALLPEPLAAPLLAQGTLVALGEAAALDGFAYYLVVPEAAIGRRRVSAFRSWLLETGSATTSATPPAFPRAVPAPDPARRA